MLPKQMDYGEQQAHLYDAHPKRKNSALRTLTAGTVLMVAAYGTHTRSLSTVHMPSPPSIVKTGLSIEDRLNIPLTLREVSPQRLEEATKLQYALQDLKHQNYDALKVAYLEKHKNAQNTHLFWDIMFLISALAGTGSLYSGGMKLERRRRSRKALRDAGLPVPA